MNQGWEPEANIAALDQESSGQQPNGPDDPVVALQRDLGGTDGDQAAGHPGGSLDHAQPGLCLDGGEVWAASAPGIHRTAEIPSSTGAP